MEREMRDLVRHYDGLGPSPLEKTIPGNASSGALRACFQRITTGFLSAMVAQD